MNENEAAARHTVTRAQAGLVAGPLLCAAALLLPPPEGMPVLAWRTAAVGVLMAAWWMTEAIPIAATALVPIVLFPLLGVSTVAAATAPYANPAIYLFLGGFLIAMGLEGCGLHRRMALAVLGVAGPRPANLILGFMGATAFISMWVSNSATVVMMLPMATSVMALARGGTQPSPGAAPRHFDVALLLGIAYAGSIGGLGTLIGTPPNALLAGFMAESYGVQIGFVQWMILGIPIVAISLPVAWLLLTKWLHPVGSEPIAGGAAMLDAERQTLGPMSRAEWTVGAITALTAAAWVSRPLIERWVPALTDAGIAISGAVLLFVVPLTWRPLRVALTWAQAERLPWSVLILFGGGLSLAAAIQETGLAVWVGSVLGALAGWPIFAVILAVTTVVVFLTELTSNTATAAAFLPVVASLAVGIGADPLLLAIPTALAASCAFMMPVATPPNAIIYGTGALTIPQMARAGLWLNLFFVALLPLVVYLMAGWLFTAS
ncbi:MAG TPA: DASS family sodium-coupled anion symporter [Vicinamibacterales bacterium]|nr:DASS family sodium-coupled anion symporter [Vicinamibacterales bacterium]